MGHGTHRGDFGKRCNLGSSASPSGAALSRYSGEAAPLGRTCAGSSSTSAPCSHVLHAHVCHRRACRSKASVWIDPRRH
jgi:hypothetical protein